MLNVWGCGQFGQHGHGNKTNVAKENSELEVFNGDKVKLVECGASHTMILTESNKLYGCGNNSTGQLGLPPNQNEFLELQHINTSTLAGDYIIGIRCGCRHSYVWTETGKSFKLGQHMSRGNTPVFTLHNAVDLDEAGSQANEASIILEEPIPLGGLQVKEVACGSNHVLFCTTDGNVFSCGTNNRGQLGTSGKVTSNVPKKVTSVPGVAKHVACGNIHSLCLTDTGDAYHWGYGPSCGSDIDIVTPVMVQSADPEFTGIVKLAGGDSHSVALSVDGIAFAWGSNQQGQLGMKMADESTSTPVNLKIKLSIGKRIVDIAARDDTTAVVLQDGAIIMWGKTMWGVFEGSNSPKSSVREKFIIKLNKLKVEKISLGSWHIAAIASLNDEAACDDDVSGGEVESINNNVASSDACGISEVETELQDFQGQDKDVQKTVNTDENINLKKTVNTDDSINKEKPVETDPQELFYIERSIVKDSEDLSLIGHGLNERQEQNAFMEITFQFPPLRTLDGSDFALACVERDNLSNIQKLELKDPEYTRSKTLHAVSDVWRVSDSRIDLNSNIAAHGKAIGNTFVREPTRPKKSRSKRDVKTQAGSRNRFNSQGFSPVPNELRRTQTSYGGFRTSPVSTWNVESILQMTSRLERSRTSSEFDTSKLGLRLDSKIAKDNDIRTRFAWKSFNGHGPRKPMDGLQNLQLSKLGGKDGWTQNRYSKSFTVHRRNADNKHLN
eukprot:Seg1605.3 transcript_id=Seg1605.3/GoldUCD/mRNA.D3Y31 product="RCC1 and BTB domain-containing protein 2" protein_id=Seg1605.3/GoldUCD/D3Y31